MTKEELRKIYLQKRLSLSDAEYTRLNFLLVQKFFTAIDLAGVAQIHTFLPLEKNKEPDTRLIIDRMKKEFPFIKIYIPRINHQTNELESILFEGTDSLVKNKWGIPEPKQGILIDSRKIDMVLTPMVIFDKDGNRVGYGKGYYDKFLSACRKDCRRVGLSLFEPVEKIDDISHFDIPVQCCVTPVAFHSF
jgi:5-formyltetrahydrofolate cyclo-ligase